MAEVLNIIGRDKILESLISNAVVLNVNHTNEPNVLLQFIVVDDLRIVLVFAQLFIFDLEEGWLGFRSLEKDGTTHHWLGGCVEVFGGFTEQLVHPPISSSAFSRAVPCLLAFRAPGFYVRAQYS